MAKVGLAQFAQIAEVIAAVAVVVSLIYVGSELGANTAAIQGASVQAVTAVHVESLLTQASDSALTRIRLAGDQDPSTLGEVESSQYFTLRWQIWIAVQNTYFQRELGLVGQRTWDVYHRIVCNMWSSPGVREVWPGHRELLDPGFIDVVENCVLS